MFFYYIWYPFHGETKDVFFYLYVLLVWIIYGWYKILQNFNSLGYITIKPSYLIWGFLVQYFLVCIYFFVVSWPQAGLWIILFTKSILYILVAATIWMSFYCLWKKILSLHENIHIKDPNIESLVSLGLWFITTMFFIFIAASMWRYDFITILIIFWISIGISFSQWNTIFYNFINYKKEYLRSPNQFLWNTSLIIDELLFLFITFLLSVNFLSVFRPFPIGWDDLGAYMNYPKLLSGAGEHIAIGKMYLWELYTWIWFLAGSQTFAFYLNSFAWVIAVIAIYLSINTFTRFTKQKYNFWLLASSIFLMMPMVVFQVAKDMKIDVGLFSLSAIALSLLYYLLFSNSKKSYILYGILGLLVWAAFAIKVTSLLLLLWIIAAVFYHTYKIRGFIVFVLLFIGIFSIANLWWLMNVVIPWSGNGLMQLGFLCSWLSVAWFAVLLFWKQSGSSEKSWNIFVAQLLSLLLWFIIALTPWMLKHISEIPSDFTPGVTTLISWISDKYDIDYSTIYKQDELELIQWVLESWISASWTTSNEDWGRYFWYEKGINNFLKLPWNLTFQTNQKGEFTDITFLFLALIPGTFLFLPYRREEYKYPVIAAIVLWMLYYVPSPISWLFTNVFSTINLPSWYGIIIWLFLLPILYFSWALNKEKKATNFFLVNLSFLTVYMWLWAISSYGVVWYGIVMYFVLILLIVICIFSSAENEETHRYVSYSVLLFVFIYAFGSAIPHGISNIKAAAYTEYKVWNFNEEVSLMSYHPEYFSIMYEINVSDDNKQELFIDYRKRLLVALSSTDDFEQVLPQIQAYTSMNELHKLIVELAKVDFPGENIDAAITQLRQELYDLVIYTPKEFKNTKNIYRVWTFLKYFISENNTRLFEDGLITQFANYIYNDEDEIVLDRFDKLEIDYILLDLNAATIDNDPAKNLTKRYEDLLSFLKNPQVELIETDSICLRLAIDNYKIEQNLETYMWLASVNHSSEYSQAQKRNACFSFIQKVISSEQSLQMHPYLNAYRNAIIWAEIDLNDAEMVIWALHQLIRWNWYKALFKIN